MNSTNPNSPRAPKPGRLASLLLDLTTREATIQHVQPLGAHFRLLTLTGAELQGQRWAPGDMLQIFFGTWEYRSYTPLAFDANTGTAQLLAFVHGNGPGSNWVESVCVGTSCRLVGPRYALSLLKPQRPLVFFGDETSFSTAFALRATPSGYRDVRFVFEVNSVEDARTVLERFGLGDAVKLIARDDGDRHLSELEREVLDAFRSAEATHGILTGKASSIQRLYKALRAAGVPGRQLTNVAYWSAGKKGL